MIIDREILSWVVADAITRIYGHNHDYYVFEEVYKLIEKGKSYPAERLIVPSFDTNKAKSEVSNITRAVLIASVLYDEETYWKRVGEEIIYEQKCEMLE